MCHISCIEFVRTSLQEEDVKGKKVIEVGSYVVNHTVRPSVECLDPQSYLGVDIHGGPGVDEICDASDLVNHFGKECFDLVICTEVLEHVRNWRMVVSDLKKVLRPNGVLLVTTRSEGFGFHGYPFDFWRYDLNDVRIVFSDMLIETAEKDPQFPGVFVKARKPQSFVEHDLGSYRLFSMIKSRRCEDITDLDFFISKLYQKCRWTLRSFLSRVVPAHLKELIKRTL